MRGVACLVVAGVLYSAGATAGIVTWTVSGTVDRITAGGSTPSAAGTLAQVGGSASLGDAFSITYSFNEALATPDLPSVDARWYGAVTRATFSIGSWSGEILRRFDPIETRLAGFNSAIIVRDGTGGNGDLYNMSIERWLGPASDPDSSQVRLSWFFDTLPNSAAITGLGFPDQLFDLASIDFNNGPVMQLAVELGLNSQAFVQGRVSSLTATRGVGVPEPGPLALLGALSLIYGGHRLLTKRGSSGS
jgi:hypothetical protein